MTLRDDYTARAAAVMRALRDGVDERVEPAPVSPASGDTREREVSPDGRKARGPAA